MNLKSNTVEKVNLESESWEFELARTDKMLLERSPSRTCSSEIIRPIHEQHFNPKGLSSQKKQILYRGSWMGLERCDCARTRAPLPPQLCTTAVRHIDEVGRCRVLGAEYPNPTAKIPEDTLFERAKQALHSCKWALPQPNYGSWQLAMDVIAINQIPAH